LRLALQSGGLAIAALVFALALQARSTLHLKH